MKAGIVCKSLGIFAVAAAAVVENASAVTDITFFSISDTHYGRGGASNDLNRSSMPGWLNGLPGKSYPAVLGGGPVGAPHGITIPGDMVETADTAQWKKYSADYSPSGAAKAGFPVYDGLGNHDVWDYAAAKITALIKNDIVKRNSQRIGVIHSDPANLHYSWDWDQVHFVQMNLFVGNQVGTQPQYDPNHSLDFLKADLAKYVGSSGRPVLILQHFNLDSSQDRYQNTQKDQMVALLKQYNCIGILHGHSHQKKIYRYQGLDIFDDGTAMQGDIMVFRILDGRMYVGNRIGDTWGTIAFQKTISMGAPVSLSTAGKPRGFAFSITDLGRIYAGNRNVRKVEILSLSGRSIRVFSPQGSELSWDRRDERGALAAPGVYLVRLLTDRGWREGKFALSDPGPSEAPGTRTWSLTGSQEPMLVHGDL